jgi:hypothetical protein
VKEQGSLEVGRAGEPGSANIRQSVLPLSLTEFEMKAVHSLDKGDSTRLAAGARLALGVGVRLRRKQPDLGLLALNNLSLKECLQLGRRGGEGEVA